MRKFFLLVSFILLSSVAIFAQDKVALPKPSEVEYGSDILPQAVLLRLPPNNKSEDVDIGISVHIGKFSAEKDRNTNLPLFESYGSRPLINISAGQLQQFLVAQAIAGKITELEVKATLDALIEAQAKVLVAVDKLTSTLIKAEYPFQPSLKALPKPE